MKKLARISFNSSGWNRPTGEARRLEKDSFNTENGFGFEDWLFREEWLLDGWRYSFLQGVNDSRNPLLKEGRPFDVTLFTIEPDKRRRYVATLRDAECLDDTQAADAIKAFEQNGWLSQMKLEIGNVGGNLGALTDHSWAPYILNLRFRIENTERYAPDAYAVDGDPVFRLNRYNLPDQQDNNDNLGGSIRTGRESSLDALSYMRKAIGPVKCSPEHARMQHRLMSELKQEYATARIVCEENFVDVTVETDNELIFYEIKSDLAPRTVLRQAVGQLLEYAFYPRKQTRYATRLVVVGRRQLSPMDQAYLYTLCEQFSLPLEYRMVEI
ncbi:hypothetical protein AWB68_00499 [Caballeronia choica]|uniref:Uncharacterized protein n=1 Tax=Caballeronia choica TaxID=326476 RepID=A0A158FEG8_9BURK|nr:hypothetical protein [Caballeronia choica]SAL17450.1 hypothetical protein AWB68_00499 [Caballeronia choica]